MALFDHLLESHSIAALPEVMIDVDGILLSTHQLAAAGWVCRIRKTRDYHSMVRIQFSNCQSNLSLSIRTKTSDVGYIWSVLGRCSASHKLTGKGYRSGLHEFTDEDMLKELCLRNKKKRKRKSNIINLFDFLEKRKQNRGDFVDVQEQKGTLNVQRP